MNQKEGLKMGISKEENSKIKTDNIEVDLMELLDEIKMYCIKNLKNLDKRKDSIYIQGKIDAFIEIYNIIKGNNS